MRITFLVLTSGTFLSLTLGLAAERFATAAVQDAAAPQIVNGSFADWKDDLPVGWSVEIGATLGGDSPKSKLTKGPGPSLELSGDVDTIAWQVVSQTIEVQPGQALRLTYEAKAMGVKREGRQFDNCYVALFPVTTDGSKSPPLVWPIDSGEYESRTRYLQVAQNVSRFNLLIFLSKTGTLNIKNISLAENDLSPEDSFDLLVKDMAANYSFFDHKRIDWKELSGRYRERAIKAKSPQQFAKVVAQMLDKLKDTHVSVLLDGKRFGFYISRTTGKHDFSMVNRDLDAVLPVGNLGLIG